jgi:hypothetical protein
MRTTLASLKKRSGLPLRDGSHVRHSRFDGTVQQNAKRMEGVFHGAQDFYGKEYFAARGYRIFPRHIGVKGVNRWADFAVARYRRVILVECMPDNFVDSTIERKSELAKVCKLWYIAERDGMKKLRKLGYKCMVLPCDDSVEWRGMHTKFWICRPAGAKHL